MAVATAERLRSIRGLVNIQRTPEPIPWESIWSSGIPPEVIYATAGRCFKYEAALLYPVTHEQNKGVSIWREQTRRELLNHLHQTPQSKEVYRSLRQANMLIPLDLRETLSERWRRCRQIPKRS